MVRLFDKICSDILITHSQGVVPGWLIGIENQNVKVVYEPGSYLFPQGELPASINGRAELLSGVEVSIGDFKKMTQIPIIMYFGGYIGKEVIEDLGAEDWRICLALGYQFIEANRHGGEATLIELTQIGIYGNTYFLMSDLNNIEIEDLLSDWLRNRNTLEYFGTNI